MSRTNSFLALVALLLSTPPEIATADEWILPENPDLYSQLSRFSDNSFPIGAQFPSEPVDCVFYASAVIDLAVPSLEGESTVYLTSVPTDFSGYFLFPNVVIRKPDGGWVRTPIPQTFDGWTHVQRSDDGVRVLLMMDNVPQAPGGTTRFVFSDDGGFTWRYVSELHLYAYFNVVSYFDLSNDGIGIAVEYNDGGTDGYDKAGYFLYRTRDWAKRWTGPEYQEFFDVSELTDVVKAWQLRRENRRPLRELQLDAYAECPEA